VPGSEQTASGTAPVKTTDAQQPGAIQGPVTPPRKPLLSDTQAIEQLERYVRELGKAVRRQSHMIPSLDLASSSSYSGLESTVYMLQNGLTHLRNAKYHRARGAFSQAKRSIEDGSRLVLLHLEDKDEISFGPDELAECLAQLISYKLPNPEDLIPIFITITRSEGEFVGVPAEEFATSISDHALDTLLGNEIPVKQWPHRDGSRYTLEIEYTLSQQGEPYEDLSGTIDYLVRVIDNSTSTTVLEFADMGHFEEPSWAREERARLPDWVEKAKAESYERLGIDPEEKEIEEKKMHARRVFKPHSMELDRHFSVLKLEP